MLSFLLIQAVGLVGTVLYFASYQCKSNKKLFILQCCSYFFYVAHLFLLGADTGAISYIICAFRSFCLGTKNRFLNSNTMCVIICLMQVAALVFTWSGWISVLPVAANMAAAIGGYTHNSRKIRIAGLCINSPLWILYDVLIGSWSGIIDEIVSDVSIIISIARYGWDGLNVVQNPETEAAEA